MIAKDGEPTSAGMEEQRIAQLEEDNRRLRRLLDQRDAPGELRHRLRSTLGLLRAVMRRSADTGRDLPGYIAQLEDRMDAIARAQALADQHGEVDLRTLLVDELFLYGATEGEGLLLSGPDVQLQAKAGQVFALALHELAINAVEHGVLGTEGGQIKVSWTIAVTKSGNSMTLTWTERGLTFASSPVHRGFGTEVLTRMLAYNLESVTDLTFGSDGLHCTIRLPLPAQVGRVAAN